MEKKNGATKRTGDKSIPKLIDEIPYPSLAGTGFEESSKPTVMLKQAVLLA